MIADEIEVAVMDGERLVQRWLCRTGTLPDGSPGAWWRGVLYPLQCRVDDGGTIDVGAGVVRPVLLEHAVIVGEDASWVLIAGSAAAAEAARAAIADQGTVISRQGRWLGEPVDGRYFDFFLRCDGYLDPNRIAAVLASPGRKTVDIDPMVQISVLEQSLADVRAELAGLRTKLTQIEMVSALSPPKGEALDVAIQPTAVFADLQAAHTRADDLEARLAARPTIVPRGILKLKDELADALAVFRPDVRLLRDSLLVMTGEFAARAGVLRAIAELPAPGSRPEGWKMLRGAERWWERHVNTGRNDLGRAYARFDTQTRMWNLLVGMKGSQMQDIEWLCRQAK